MTGSGQEVSGRYDYLPFGEELYEWRAGYGGSSVRRKFTGYEKDDETGLDYAQARYYFYQLKPERLCLLILALLCPLSARAQADKSQDQHGLRMRGTVKSVTVEEDRAGPYIKVGLLYDLANTAQTPIILWKREGRPEGSWPYAFTGLTIARTPNFSRGEVLDTYRGGPSVNRGPEWDDMRKALDQPYPPAGSTIVLSSGQTISFSYEVTIVCNRKWGDSAPEHPTLAELQEVGTLWLRVYHEVWSDDLEPSSRDSSALKFGRKLQQRWNPYGNLLLGDIYSEPIRIDLKAANYKLSAR